MKLPELHYSKSCSNCYFCLAANEKSLAEGGSDKMQNYCGLLSLTIKDDAVIKEIESRLNGFISDIKEFIQSARNICEVYADASESGVAILWINNPEQFTCRFHLPYYK